MSILILRYYYLNKSLVTSVEKNLLISLWWYNNYTFRFTTMDKELTAGSNIDDSIIASVNHDLNTNAASKKLFDNAEIDFKYKINAWNRN